MVYSNAKAYMQHFQFTTAFVAVLYVVTVK